MNDLKSLAFSSFFLAFRRDGVSAFQSSLAPRGNSENSNPPAGPVAEMKSSLPTGPSFHTAGIEIRFDFQTRE